MGTLPTVRAFLHCCNMCRPSSGKVRKNPCGIFLKAVDRVKRLIISPFFFFFARKKKIIYMVISEGYLGSCNRQQLAGES